MGWDINKETALMLFIEVGIVVFLLYLNWEAGTLSKVIHPEVMITLQEVFNQLI